jgi:hypothetical protein
MTAKRASMMAEVRVRLRRRLLTAQLPSPLDPDEPLQLSPPLDPELDEPLQLSPLLESLELDEPSQLSPSLESLELDPSQLSDSVSCSSE